MDVMNYTDFSETEEPAFEKPHNCWFKFHRLVIYILLLSSYAISLFHRICPSIVEKDMAESYGVTSLASMGVFTSLYFYSYGVVQPFTGLLADVTEPGYLMGVTQLIASAGTIICGLSKSFMIGCVGRVIVGLGCGPTFVCANRCMVNWFPPNWYSFVLGLMYAGGSCGYLLAQGPLAAFSEKFGWRWAFNGLAIIGAAIAILDMLIVRGNPTKFKYRPVNTQVEHEKTARPIKELCITLFRNFKTVSRSWKLWLYITYGCLVSGPIYDIGGNWGAQWLMDVLRYTKQQSGTVLMTQTVASIIGHAVVPPIGNLFKYKKFMFIFSSLIQVGYLAFGFLKDGVAIWIVCLIFAVLSVCGCIGPTLFSIAINNFDHNQAATVIGMVNTFVFFISAGYQLVSSVVIAKFGSSGSPESLCYTKEGYFWGLWVFSAASYGVASILGAFIEAPPDPPKDSEALLSN